VIFHDISLKAYDMRKLAHKLLAAKGRRDIEFFDGETLAVKTLFPG